MGSDRYEPIGQQTAVQCAKGQCEGRAVAEKDGESLSQISAREAAPDEGRAKGAQGEGHQEHAQETQQEEQGQTERMTRHQCRCKLFTVFAKLTRIWVSLRPTVTHSD